MPMVTRVRVLALTLALGWCGAMAAWGQSPEPDKDAPWGDHPTDPARMRITMEVLHFPDGPAAEALPLSGFMVSYMGMSGSMFVVGAQNQCVEDL